METQYYKIGSLMGKIRGVDSYVTNSEGKEYATIGECMNAIANRISEQKCSDTYFAAIKFVISEPEFISGTTQGA